MFTRVLTQEKYKCTCPCQISQRTFFVRNFWKAFPKCEHHEKFSKNCHFGIFFGNFDDIIFDTYMNLHLIILVGVYYQPLKYLIHSKVGRWAINPKYDPSTHTQGEIPKTRHFCGYKILMKIQPD